MKAGKDEPNPEDRIRAMDVDLWLESNSCIMLRAVDPTCRDPVELTAAEARVLAQELLRLAALLDEGDQQHACKPPLSGE